MIRYTRLKGALGLPDRVSRRDYDSLKQVVIGFVDPLNFQSLQTVERKNGNVVNATDPNGLVTGWSYDTFGRVTGETRPDGTSISLTRSACSGVVPACATGAVMRLNAVGSDGSRSWTDLDILEREVGGGKSGFDGTPIVWTKTYNGRGEIASESVPRFMSDPSYYVTYTYDSVGRLKTRSAPKSQYGGSNVTSISYDGFTISETDALAHTTTRVVNEVGRLVSVTDPGNSVTTYSYDALGNLLSTTDPAGNQIVNTYDIRGQKQSMSDPDLGVWTYNYNHFGELVTQTDAKSQVQTLTYDAIGRVTSRAEMEGTTTWTWDTLWKGALTNVSAPGGYLREHTYDTLGRGKTVRTVINGLQATFTSDYDSQGRLSKLTYPQGLAVTYTYNNYGFLNRLSDANSSALYWQGDAQDAFGNWTLSSTGNGVSSLRSYDLANGSIQTSLASTSSGPVGDVMSLNYTWDDAGNLKRRTDQRQGGLYEEFTYDALDRVTATHLAPVSGPAVPDVVIGYNAIGNITSKSDVGAYSYGLTKPHAITGFTGGPRGTAAVSYDANGNQLSGPGRTMTWTSFNLPKTITQGASSAAYDYGPDRERTYQRSVQPATDTSSADEVMYVAGGLFERDLNGSTVTWRNSLVVGNETIGLVIQSGPNGSTQTLKYIHRDHLDSVSAITGPSGTVLERLSYDMFGKRRNADWRPDGADALLKVGHETDAGFTDHEHIDHVSLIHMRGRVYDPITGRFTSADPYVQFPDNSQSFNRYSYVLNNPLTHVDPSGFGIHPRKALKKTFKKIKHTVKKVLHIGIDTAVKLEILHFAAGSCGAGADAEASGVASLACTYVVNRELNQVVDHVGNGGASAGNGGYEPAPPMPQAAAMSFGISPQISSLENSNSGKNEEGSNPSFANGAVQAGETLLSPYVSSYDTNHPNFHRYAIGPTELCDVGPACSFDVAAGVVGTESVPVNFIYSGPGRYNLPFGLGTDPIFHFHPEPGVWLNVTDVGHRYDLGSVAHGLYESGGKLYLYTLGVGVGQFPLENERVGRLLFGAMHLTVRNQILDRELLPWPP